MQVFQTTEEAFLDNMRYVLACPMCYPIPELLYIVSDPDLRLRWERILRGDSIWP
jgi:hypothetical protein